MLLDYFPPPLVLQGHDTTAAAAGWAILLIGHHPDVQARLHTEIDEVFGMSNKTKIIEV